VENRPGERWLIDCRSINELIDEKLPTLTRACVDQLLASILCPRGWVGQLVQAIRAGELRAYGPAENGSVAVGAWLLKPQDFAAWQQARAENKSRVFPGLSVVKAAALLGVKEQCAYAFVQLGLLWSTAVERGRRTQLMVKPQAIDRFRRGYILGPEIAVYLGSRPGRRSSTFGRPGFAPLRAIHSKRGLPAVRLGKKQKADRLPRK
jgi:hypothetical protein